MYFVDRQKIEATLVFLDNHVQLIESKKTFNGQIEQLALERIVHIMIESVLDVGNLIIDGFIMRDPGSYEDIIDILIDEKVVSKEDGEALKNLIRYRKMVVHDYLHINHKQLIAEVQKNIACIKTFSSSVLNYLANELGPVTAFRSER
ncbi:DUF86 domain-containing protein [Cytobacillus sp. Hm23]